MNNVSKVIQVIPRSKRTGGAEKLVNLLCSNHFKDGNVIIDSYEVDGAHSFFSFYGFVKKTTKESFHKNEKLLLHAHLTQGIYFVALVSFFINVECVLTEHNTTNRRRVWLFWPMEFILYSRFRKFICISNKVKTELKDWLKWSDERKFIVIHNGAEFLGKRNTPFHTQKLRILSIGSLTYQKGFDLSTSMLCNHPNLWSRYTILGDGPLRAQLFALVDNVKHEIPNNEIILAGHQALVRPFIVDCDVLLLPSRWEGFGLVVIEALSTGTPVVVSDIEGVGEISEECIGFYKYDTFDSDSLRLALTRVRNHLISNSVEVKRQTLRIAERFRIDTMACNYLKVYNES